MKILSVVGNRPQFIKSGPVSAALREAGVEEVGLRTGQHWDRDLSDVFYEELGLPEPRYNLDLHTADAETMRPQIAAVLAEERPDWTLVYGDTNSTLAGTEAAGDAAVPVAHVEAGLRSGDLSMPEEHNRIAVDAVSALLLAPDDRSRETLLGEGVSGRIDVVGDVMADARLPPRADRARALDRAAPARARAGRLRRCDDPPRGQRQARAAGANRGRLRPPRRARHLSRPPAHALGARRAPGRTWRSSPRSATSTWPRSFRRHASSSPTRAGCKRRRTGTACRA